MDPLEIVAGRHWKVGIPLRQTLHCGAYKRQPLARLLVEIKQANGVKSYGETMMFIAIDSACDDLSGDVVLELPVVRESAFQFPM